MKDLLKQIENLSDVEQIKELVRKYDVFTEAEYAPKNTHFQALIKRDYKEKYTLGYYENGGEDPVDCFFDSDGYWLDDVTHYMEL